MNPLWIVGGFLFLLLAVSNLWKGEVAGMVISLTISLFFFFVYSKTS